MIDDNPGNVEPRGGWDGKTERRHKPNDVLRDVRILMAVYFLTLLVLGAVVVGALNHFQGQRDKDQRTFDRQLDASLLDVCRALNVQRRASNHNSTVLLRFLRAAERTRRVSAAHTSSAKEREADLRAAAVYDQLADSYTILKPLDCRSALEARR